MQQSTPPAENTADIDLASVDQVLSTARSVRRKIDFEKPVPAHVLYDCINLATQAPIGLGGENWRFLIISRSDEKLKVAQIYRSVLDDLERQRGLTLKPTQRALANRLQEMPAMILVCVDGSPPDPETHTQIGFYGSILPAAWSLMLALRARGLGSTWTSLLSSRQGEMASALGIPDSVTQTVMLPVGYTKGARLKPADRLGAEHVTFWNQWGASEEDG